MCYSTHGEQAGLTEIHVSYVMLIASGYISLLVEC